LGLITLNASALPCRDVRFHSTSIKILLAAAPRVTGTDRDSRSKSSVPPDLCREPGRPIRRGGRNRIGTVLFPESALGAACGFAVVPRPTQPHKPSSDNARLRLGEEIVPRFASTLPPVSKPTRSSAIASARQQSVRTNPRKSSERLDNSLARAPAHCELTVCAPPIAVQDA